MDQAALGTTQAILLYDGYCALCNASVQWLLKHDKEAKVKLAALQGQTAAALGKKFPIPEEIDSVVLIYQGRVYHYAEAVQQLLLLVRPKYWALFVLKMLPKFLKNLGYRLIASIRYRLWGKLDQCPLPAPEFRERFLP